ncbi:MAG: hypothetical protein SCJ97_04645 [Bacillota bacterium]|nr:hypothetical protein [Bacillota bacterium]
MNNKILAMIIVFVGLVALFFLIKNAVEPDRYFSAEGNAHNIEPQDEVKNETGEPGNSEIIESRFDLNGGSIEVIELIPDRDSTHLYLNLEKVSAFRIYPSEIDECITGEGNERLDELIQKIYLVDIEGREYKYGEGNYEYTHTYSSACATGEIWSSEVYLELPPLEGSPGHVILVVPLSEEREYTIKVTLE